MKAKIAEQVKLLARGTVEIFTEQELADKLTKAAKEGRQLRIKLGLDPTSPDIHLGHTVVLRKMRQFQDLGHKAVLIIGDYTARIGDPSGQDSTRPILSTKQIEKNAKTYFEQAGKILDTSEDKLEIRHNSDWLSDLGLTDVIMLTSIMTVARMLERDTFEHRHRKTDVFTSRDSQTSSNSDFEQREKDLTASEITLLLPASASIGVHEFLYPLMQGYDSVMVKSDVELGGTDQTFNNLVGRDIQRAHNQTPQVVITMPILVGLDGKEKMSKSKGNYIGITDEPNDMFGKIMSVSDDMMENYFTLLTDLPTEKIAELTDPAKTHPKEAKVLLGKTIVSQFYNDSTAQAAAAEFDKVFAQGQLPDDIPEIEISAEPIMASKLLVHCKLLESTSEAKRMIKTQSAVSINGNKINDPNAEITPTDGMIIQVGKRKFAKIKTKN
jgi:tyrosyl-tRNA synthetase